MGGQSIFKKFSWSNFLQQSRAGSQETPLHSQYELSRAVFLCCIGVTFLVAFFSIFVQIPGLYGDAGLLPLSRLVGAERSRLWQTFVKAEPPTVVVVSGAGVNSANGQYQASGWYGGTHQFMLHHNRRDFSIFRVGSSDSWHLMDEHSVLYAVQGTVMRGGLAYPPETGWGGQQFNSKFSGVQPPPRLQVVDTSPIPFINNTMYTHKIGRLQRHDIQDPALMSLRACKSSCSNLAVRGSLFRQ